MKIKKPRSPLKTMQSKAKRNIKKSVIPGYGKGGATALKDPQKFIKKKVLGQSLSKKKTGKKGFFSIFK